MKKMLLILVGLYLVGLSAMILLCGIRIHDRPRVPVAPQNITATVDNTAVIDACHHAVTCGGVHNLEGYHKFTLPYNIWGYVQYRVGDKTYFTRAKRMIPKGTVVWEDAYGHMILGRCGNMVTQSLSDEVAPVVEPVDIFPGPPPEIGETPPTVDIPPTTLVPPTVPTPPSTPPGPPITPCCGFVVPPGPPVSVPEPSSFLLCGIGVLGILGRKYARRKTRSTEDAG